MKIELNDGIGLALVCIGIGGPVVCGVILTIRAMLVGFNKGQGSSGSR
jgi:hypothetical protein